MDGDEKFVAADNSGDEKAATPNCGKGGHCQRFPFSTGRRNQKSKMHHRYLNFSPRVIPDHELSKCVIVILKHSSGL
jgi:hypothetical protein